MDFDVKNTIKQRYVEVSRDELPKDFTKFPERVLHSLKEEYEVNIHKHSPNISTTYHDWSIRVSITPEESLSLTESDDIGFLNKFVVFRGIVMRARKTEPRIIESAYVCNSCGNVIMVPEDGQKPYVCDCKSRSFTLCYDSSSFVTTQHIQLVEPFDEIRGSRTPKYIDCRLDGTLAGVVKVGERYAVGGILTAIPQKKGYEFLLVVNNIIPFSPVTELPVPKIKENIMNTLIDSFAPQIKGHETIKESILLLLAGGSHNLEHRSDIHILIVGDPGIAKSALLREASKTALIGRYTAGAGSSAAGLAAGMVKGKDGIMYLEAGVAVLADMGVLCMDEFDKLDSNDRKVLHEVMEQQTVSISKAGISATLNTRVSVLAAANPREGFWDPSLSIGENIDLPQSLMTRFDLIYNLRDVHDQNADLLIAKHIQFGGGDAPLTRDELTGYIESIRSITPKMPSECSNAIVQYYTHARADEDGEIRITPRQLQAINRLSSARAKLRGNTVVEMEDVKRAMYLVENMIQLTLIDPDTGTPSMKKSLSGTRSSVRGVDEAVQKIEGEFTANDINIPGISFTEVERALEKLHQSGILLEPSPGVYKRM